MSTNDKSLSLPLSGSLVDPEVPDRGAGDASTLTSINKAIVDAGQREPVASSVKESADAAERWQLIFEIRTMRRMKPNVALQAIVTGAATVSVGWLVFKGLQLLFAERK